MKKIYSLLFTLSLFAFITSCSSDKSQLLVGKWGVESIESSEEVPEDQKEIFEKMMKEMKENTSFVFNEDATMSTNFADQVTKGKWVLKKKDSKLFLTVTEMGGASTTSEVEELTENKLVLKETEADITNIVTMVKK